jgi:dCMP deaminase
MKWDLRFLALAKHVAGWSKDPSTKVGAVIVRPDRTIASIGFNGLPRGVNDTSERLSNREFKYPMVVHAEVNAITAAKESLAGYTLYCTHPPCAGCAGTTIQAGIHRVVTIQPTEDLISRWGQSFVLMKEMFSESGVQLDMLNETDVFAMGWKDGVDIMKEAA